MGILKQIQETSENFGSWWKFRPKICFEKNIFIFWFCIYFPSVHTTSFSSQLHPPRWLEQIFYFHPLNHPLYYRAPAGVSPIFGATLLTFSELISWTEKSDDQKKLFFEHVGGIIHGEKLFGRCCGRSTRLKRILHENVTDNSRGPPPPTWRGWVPVRIL